MDYEAIDRDMSRAVVTCVHNGVRFYLTPNRMATDMLEEAEVYRDRFEAMRVADEERKERAWVGMFPWQEEFAFVCWMEERRQGRGV